MTVQTVLHMPGEDDFPTNLHALNIAEGIFDPPFKPNHFHYDVHVREATESVTLVLGFNFKLYSLRHLPKVEIDFEELELHPELKGSISNRTLIFQPNDQTLQGSFSSVSTPNFASKYSLESS